MDATHTTETETMNATATETLSNRDRKALDVLRAGGYFRKALERSYMGGEKFQTRLHAADGSVVKGFGTVTRYALSDAGMLRRRNCFTGSAHAEEWIAAWPTHDHPAPRRPTRRETMDTTTQTASTFDSMLTDDLREVLDAVIVTDFGEPTDSYALTLIVLSETLEGTGPAPGSGLAVDWESMVWQRPRVERELNAALEGLDGILEAAFAVHN